ncbi:hypothetical protein C4579_04560 [Candidatus Microgenomates bacterium]|nr:MAG: hypothetical protein C4579_04560 [Candidatus Microgenomates bacterium]
MKGKKVHNIEKEFYRVFTRSPLYLFSAPKKYSFVGMITGLFLGILVAFYIFSFQYKIILSTEELSLLYSQPLLKPRSAGVILTAIPILFSFAGLLIGKLIELHFKIK